MFLQKREGCKGLICRKIITCEIPISRGQYKCFGDQTKQCCTLKQYFSVSNIYFTSDVRVYCIILSRYYLVVATTQKHCNSSSIRLKPTTPTYSHCSGAIMIPLPVTKHSICPPSFITMKSSAS